MGKAKDKEPKETGRPGLGAAAAPRIVAAIFLKEFKGFFLSPIAYIVMTVFLLPQNWFFYVLMGYLASGTGAGLESPMGLILGSNIFLWLVLFAVIPAITMKLFAEEKRSGTIEMLMTAPVTEIQVVIGKYLAAVAFYVVMWVPTLSYVIVVWKYGNPDMMKIVAGYLGMMLVGAMFLSFGLLASSVTRNQIIAYVLGMLMCIGVLFMNIFLGNLPGMGEFPGMKAAVEYIDLLEHMSHGFSKGIVDTRNVVYYLSLTLLSLFVTVQVAESRKWK
jgi:ABC-2 type transport system permease protein